MSSQHFGCSERNDKNESSEHRKRHHLAIKYINKVDTLRSFFKISLYILLLFKLMFKLNQVFKVIRVVIMSTDNDIPFVLITYLINTALLILKHLLAYRNIYQVKIYIYIYFHLLF